MRDSIDYHVGYLQHMAGICMRTEKVNVKHTYSDNWLAWFEGRWRKVYIQVNRTYIIFQGEKITIQIEGI